MKKYVQLTENELKNVIIDILNEENGFELTEYGHRGLWKPKWSEQDQLLAMYNYLYGIEDLGINKEELMDEVIGSSVDSFNQQTANFRSLYTNRTEGLPRESNPQNFVYAKYKNLSKSELKKICLNIIQERLANPDVAVTKKKLGQEIGAKRDEIKKGREDALRKAGISNPEKWKVTRSEPLNPPIEDEPENTTEGGNEINQIKDFLSSIVDKIRNVSSKDELEKLATDLEFIIEYMDDELIDKNTSNMVAEMKYIFHNLI